MNAKFLNGEVVIPNGYRKSKERSLKNPDDYWLSSSGGPYGPFSHQWRPCGSMQGKVHWADTIITPIKSCQKNKVKALKDEVKMNLECLHIYIREGKIEGVGSCFATLFINFDLQRKMGCL